jgi:hypothetical protein
MMETLIYTGTLVTTHCWCGIHYAMPQALYDEANRSGKTTYCPIGHAGVFKNSENERLRKEKRELLERLDRQRAATMDAQREAEHAERRRRSTKAVLTKTKKRLVEGKCPRCSKTFPDLAGHMHDKHPDYVEPQN